MDSSSAPLPPPPPSPPPGMPGEKPKSYVGLIVTVCVLAFIFVVGIMGAVGYFALQQVKKRQALAQVEKTVAEERTKMADSIRNGDAAESSAALGRLKDQLGKSASQMSGSDAGAARAMAAYLGKVQAQLGAYNKALEQMKAEKVLSFDISDRSQIEAHRQIVHAFLDANGKLTNMLQHGEDMARAELDAQKVSAATRDATLAGYSRSQAQLRPIQLRIRQADEILGQSALGVLDILDKSWGRWERDTTNGRLRFHDDQSLNSFNELVRKIQSTAADQEKAQEELISAAKAAQAH